MKSLISVFSSIAFSLKVSYKATKRYFVYKCILLLTTTAVPLVSIWLWKEILNGLGSSALPSKDFWTPVALYCLMQILTHCKDAFDSYVSERYYDAISFYRDDLLISKTSRMDLSFFDSASLYDKFEFAQSGFDAMDSLTWSSFAVISKLINIVATFLIVLRYNYILAIVSLVAIIPAIVYNDKYAREMLAVEQSLTQPARKSEYYGGVFQDVKSLFEIKLNNLGAYFLKKYAETWHYIYDKKRKHSLRHTLIGCMLFMLNAVADAYVLVASIGGVIRGLIGVGDLQYNLSVVAMLRDESMELFSSLTEIYTYHARIVAMNEFFDTSPLQEISGDAIPRSQPDIEFAGVYFRYPNSEEYAVSDCSFTIKSGESVALIGLNGSGKSTIIKLLFRFYDVQRGQILIDGIDINSYDVYALRRVFGVLFQEYITYALPLREAIALSDFGEVNDDERLAAACAASGFDKVVSDWEEGLGANLGRFFYEDGRDLSGGQWQLLSLSRAYFRNSGVLVLDEPSAALDPLSEQKIFQQMEQLASDKTSLMITHRLASAARVDKILVVEAGTIIEQGTHDSLMNTDSLYARLYKLQAERYV